MTARVELDTTVLDQIRARLRELVRTQAQVGIFSESGTVDEDPSLTVAQLGAFHEFGLGVPERSFLRSTTHRRARDTGELLGKATARVITGQSPDVAMGVVGEVWTGWVRETIRDRIPPPLAPATLRAKTVAGKVGDVPLVDTGQLIQSIAPKVVHG